MDELLERGHGEGGEGEASRPKRRSKATAGLGPLGQPPLLHARQVERRDCDGRSLTRYSALKRLPRQGRQAGCSDVVPLGLGIHLALLRPLCGSRLRQGGQPFLIILPVQDH